MFKFLKPLFFGGSILLSTVVLPLLGPRLHAAESPAASRRMAPQWTLKDVDGHEVHSEQFKGKVLILDFWATWCGPCVSELPGYAALQKKYGRDGLAIVGVLYQDPKTAAAIKRFAAAKGINYQIVEGNDTIADAFGGLEALPTTFLIDREGRIVNQKVGTVDHAQYADLVVRTLAEPAR